MLGRRKLWLVLALAGATLLSLIASLPVASADSCTVTVRLPCPVTGRSTSIGAWGDVERAAKLPLIENGNVSVVV